jgi:hypothetical protein
MRYDAISASDLVEAGDAPRSLDFKQKEGAGGALVIEKTCAGMSGDEGQVLRCNSPKSLALAASGELKNWRAFSPS